MSAAMKKWLPAILIAAAVTGFYGFTVNFERCCLDDNQYIGKTYLLTFTGEHLRYFLHTPVAELHSPLVMYSLMTDYLAGGETHLVSVARMHNILLLAVSCVLLYGLLVKFGHDGKTALLFTILYACHPQRPESVIWLAERKDMLVLLFLLIALRCFLAANAETGKTKTTVFLFCGVIAHALSFGAKPALFGLPAVLFAAGVMYFSWNKRRKLLLTSCPFIAVSLFYMLLNREQLFSFAAAPLADNRPNMLTALANFWRYGISFLCPGRVMALHPLYEPDAGLLLLAVLPLLLLAVFAICRYREPYFRRYVLPGFFAYACLLLPVLGWRRVGNTDFSDRYGCLPGIILTLGFMLVYLHLRRRFPKYEKVLPKLAGLYVLVTIVGAFLQMSAWKDSISLLEQSAAPDKPHPQVLPLLAQTAWEYGDGEYALDICRRLRNIPYAPEYRAGHAAYADMLQTLIAAPQLDNEEVKKRLDNLILSPQGQMLIPTFPWHSWRMLFSTAIRAHLQGGQSDADRKKTAEICFYAAKLTEKLDTVESLNYASLGYRFLGDYSRAKEKLLEALSLAPDDANLRANLAFLNAM